MTKKKGPEKPQDDEEERQGDKEEDRTGARRNDKFFCFKKTFEEELKNLEGSSGTN